MNVKVHRAFMETVLMVLTNTHVNAFWDIQEQIAELVCIAKNMLINTLLDGISVRLFF